MKEVKLVWVGRYDGEWNDITGGYEAALTKLVNEGWQIVTAGGGQGGTARPIGFVVLQRERS